MIVEDRTIRMSDGVPLAVTLYLPDPALGTQPCLVEALPYRKDDLTSSYDPSYRSLCEKHGYAVCRVDVRGTGSSGGDAIDEYPREEQSDLAEVFRWLAAQEWCDGQIGMWGTSYSGFNSLQMACEQPPELKAICAIYATDDRWTDDVHWRGGARKLVDLVDYCHYMAPMCVLPPVPAVWGEGWQEEWRRRLETNEPWLLRWLRESTHGEYWNHGSVRIDGGPGGYERIQVPTMLIAGWADGYRNNSFRTVAALAGQGTPHRLLAGPWGHADPTTAIPGPRIDAEAEIVAWFDHWLRGRGAHADGCDVFVRASTRPEPDLDLHEGRWLRLPSVPPTRAVVARLEGVRVLQVQPDVGTTAWIDCAGHFPWGLSADQREDDARSLTWDLDPPPAVVVGHPVLTLRLSADAPAASLSVKLCDVFPDGTSALVTRGSLDVAFRDGLHQPPRPVVPGEEMTVTVELDACAYEWAPGQQMRVSIAGADWPNTVAPPAPVLLTVDGGVLSLPVLQEEHPEPTFEPGEEKSNETLEGTGWEIADDVLRRRTIARTLSESEYTIPHDGTAREKYVGEVAVDRRTFAQTVDATTTFVLRWPEAEVRVESVLHVDIDGEAFDVQITTTADLGSGRVHERSWRERIPRSTAG